MEPREEHGEVGEVVPGAQVCKNPKARMSVDGLDRDVWGLGVQLMICKLAGTLLKVACRVAGVDPAGDDEHLAETVEAGPSSPQSCGKGFFLNCLPFCTPMEVPLSLQPAAFVPQMLAGHYWVDP
eukprot:799275-Amphidinium_carterae.1